MTATPALADIRTRVENQLVDNTLIVFTSDAIDESIQQALMDVNLALGQTYTITGLNAAAATTLPADIATALVQGAAGYAVQAQTVKQSGTVGIDPNQRQAANYQVWAKNKLYYFKQTLEQFQRRSFFAGTTAPYSTLAWDEDDSDAGVGEEEE